MVNKIALNLAPSNQKSVGLGRVILAPWRLIKIAQKQLEDWLPNWGHNYRRRKWERKWANPAYQPFWRTEKPQKELLEAIGSGWFRKDRWVYDIGCGAGETSRWLTEQGFSALGFDFSPAAIEICREMAGPTNERLRFEVLDICADQLNLEPTANIIDRGCFHAIPKGLRHVYARNVARMSEPGAHFLLISATYQQGNYALNPNASSPEQLREEGRQLFTPYFAIERVEPALLNAVDNNEPMPAVAFWMVRNEEQV
jgi:SAM-dependent methyltransferase